MPPISQTRKIFSRRSRRSGLLNACHSLGGKLADTLRLNDPTREAAVAAISAVSLPVLWDKGLQSLDVVGRWCNLHLRCGPPSEWSAPGAIERERARSLNERRGRDKGRDDPSNSVAGSKHPQQSSHAACSKSHSDKFCDRHGSLWRNMEQCFAFLISPQHAPPSKSLSSVTDSCATSQRFSGDS